MKKTDRSRKAREMHAEQLLKISTSLLTAFFIAIIIVPISSIITASFNNSSDISMTSFLLRLFGSWFGVVFIAAEFALIYIAGKTRENALSIYDELYPDKDNKC